MTNAYTESLNSLIRVMNRLGRGYSFEALRAKILFAEGAHKHKNSRPKFERKERPPVRVPNTRDFSMGRVVPGNDWELFAGFDAPKPPKPYQEPSTQPEKNYGADISTLIRLIEAGEL